MAGRMLIGATALRKHLPHFGLHAVPDTTQVDAHDAFQFVVARF